MASPLLNDDGTPQRWTDGIPAAELEMIAREMGVTVEAILADEELQIDADVRHHEWLERTGQLAKSDAFVDYCTSQAGG